VTKKEGVRVCLTDFEWKLLEDWRRAQAIIPSRAAVFREAFLRMIEDDSKEDA
jgi:hypothetical protein